MAHFRSGFRAFLTADLAREIATANATAVAFEQERLAAERKEEEVEELKDELRRLTADCELTPNEAGQIELAVASASLVELRKLITNYREVREREAEIARERQREILWLESEFEAIPITKRAEALEAWQLFQQAITFADQSFNYSSAASSPAPHATSSRVTRGPRCQMKAFPRKCLKRVKAEQRKGLLNNAKKYHNYRVHLNAYPA